MEQKEASTPTHCDLLRRPRVVGSIREIRERERLRDARSVTERIQGEPRKANPNLLPIGDGFGFVVYLRDVR